LFERVGKSLNLTTAGAELLVHVSEMAIVANRGAVRRIRTSLSLLRKPRTYPEQS
jgi:hypothetical protein